MLSYFLLSQIPRPDNKPDDLGLKFLDEPSSTQSDPTVLELQLRALSKKVQYGDVVVRSIEDAAKNPAAIDRWIQSISDLHRTKPPPQVFYKKPMPDIDALMDVWPSDFETALEKMSLPSPDLDMSLAEYAKLLCALLDIPTYDNPIESIHLMFSLFIEFRNNPHFQAQGGGHGGDQLGGEGKDDMMMMYGNADVMEINQGSGYK
jgi:intraflagellar transport protein 46